MKNNLRFLPDFSDELIIKDTMEKKNTNTNLQKLRNLTPKLERLTKEDVIALGNHHFMKNVIIPKVRRSNTMGDNELR